ncbi:MAG TPA: gamma carbonic anhydrase family protein, partial [Candidatus Dormibacteraeota bacterium]
MPEFELGGRRPRVHPDAYVAPTAVLIGDVELGPGASVWFGVVLRGDEAGISIGAGSNVQDNVVIHCSRELPTVIGENVTIGHMACLEGCTVEDRALVGTGAIMLQRS